MNFEFVRTPWWIRCSIPFATWKINTADKSVFLTFDDSPSPITPSLLDCLQQFDAKATFFCIGQNIKDRPDEFRQIVSNDHSVGNHTMTHVNGWKTSHVSYLSEFEQCQKVIREFSGRDSFLFRPPFGRISFRQMFSLRSMAKIVMWDVLSLDYRRDVSADQVTRNVVKNCRGGSIPLLHDSELAAQRVLNALPVILEQLRDSGFVFQTLENHFSDRT